jgi:uncharacterized protein YuzE
MAKGIAQQQLTQLTMQYDAASDVLYCAFGEPRSAIGVESDDQDGVVLRVDPQTDEIVGFTVVNFLKRFTRKRPSR